MLDLLLAMTLYGHVSIDNRPGRIGVVVNALNQSVVYLVKDGPAHKAGIKSGDVIIVPDRDHITGPAGSLVEVKVKRGSEVLTFELERCSVDECSKETVRE
jgi:C-terminal processing protease CtpA/Prc